MAHDPKEIHDHEQGEAAMREVAFFIWTYYGELVRLGMSEESACKLTLAYQDRLFGNAFDGGHG